MLRCTALIRLGVLVSALAASGVAAAQGAAPAPPPATQLFEPPAGKGRGVLVVSGQSGPGNYAAVAKQIAGLGFHVALIDGNDVFKKDNAGLPAFKAAVDALAASPKTVPGKLGAVGFSLGGGAVLTYATRMPDRFAAVVAYYPFTSFITKPDDFAAQIKVPTLILAGGKDTFRDCCKIERARKLAELGKAGTASVIELVEYPQAEHIFILPGAQFRAADAADALKRTAAHLGAALR
jgi:alpha-beta hydrolase superfamily lysophospholipase